MNRLGFPPSRKQLRYMLKSNSLTQLLPIYVQSTLQRGFASSMYHTLLMAFCRLELLLNAGSGVRKTQPEGTCYLMSYTFSVVLPLYRAVVLESRLTTSGTVFEFANMSGMLELRESISFSRLTHEKIEVN